MASAQYNRYIWLVDTICSAGKITRKEIDRKWRKYGVSAQVRGIEWEK